MKTGLKPSRHIFTAALPDRTNGWFSRVAERFSAARVVGEMTLAVTEVIGAANLSPATRWSCSSLYGLDRLRGDLLVDIMKSHPRVLMGSTVLENLCYIPPDEWAATHR